MSRENAIDIFIKRLKTRSEPLSVADCVKASDWLNDYVVEHDENLLRECFLTTEENGLIAR